MATRREGGRGLERAAALLGLLAIACASARASAAEPAAPSGVRTYTGPEGPIAAPSPSAELAPDPAAAIEPALEPAIERPATIEGPGAVPLPSVEKVEGDREEARPLDPRPRHRWIYNNLIGARYNPLGLINELTLGYRYQLVDKNSILFNESFIAVQAHAVLTPAYAGGGPKLDIQPAAVLNLSVAYDCIGYFGALGSLQSFPSATADWSDTRVKELANLGLNYGALTHTVTLSGLLQGKVKNVAVRDNVKFYWSDFVLREGDRVFYSQTLDMLLSDRGWATTNDLDVLYLFDFGLTLGARYTYTYAFYDEQHFAPGEEVVNVVGPTHRVGPAIIYTFSKRPDRRFDEPSLIILSQWWAKHPYRTGQDVHAAIPYFVVAFTFKGDLFPDPARWHAKTQPRERRRRSRR
ncbi:MAG: hypothetical protein H6713_34850 [Myxococcales bacterium]|nr:hypothetical protein [Myxococcales bacterium]